MGILAEGGDLFFVGVTDIATTALTLDHFHTRARMHSAPGFGLQRWPRKNVAARKQATKVGRKIVSSIKYR